ncbi:MAG: hypothetical protein KF715_14680 [Candidatus Didemnitutus sp.]|nr:hypothetical protein [Candidatus Didemnitutus sp.]
MSPLLLRSFRLLALLVAFALGGCVTTDQVRDIVRSSNYEMLVSADPALATTVPADANTGPKPSPGAAERLTTFLQQHPDDPVLGPALNLRQALLYLNERQFALAQASFEKLKGAKFTTARDEALAAAFPTIKWWAEQSLAGGGVFRAERANATAQMQALATSAASGALKPCPDVADYFLEMRAWIGLKAGFAVVLPADAAFQQQTLQDAINGWTDTFTTAQLALLNQSAFGPNDALTLSTRRVLRLRTLLTTLATVAKSGGSLVPPPTLQFHSADVQRYYEAKLAAP